MLKVIVTQRIDYIVKYGETRDAIDQKLSEWLFRAGFLPIPIPNNLVVLHNDKDILVNDQTILKNWISTIKPNALLLSGGNDIGEYPLRDETEKFLLDWAQSKKIPVLGICRGMQMMADWAGAKLHKIENHIGTRHKLKICNSNNKWPKEINSYHEWGLVDCPYSFEVKAYSDDEVIKAIKHKELPWEGWMWHPERESPFNDIDYKRLNVLFNNLSIISNND